MKTTNTKTIILAAMFAALIFLGTFIIRIPIPATSGYIHFGDGFIYIAAAILPMPFAIAAAAIGGFLSDMLAGYMFYAPWTAIIKALMALSVVLILRAKKGPALTKISFKPSLTATIIAGIINVGGYFIVECIMYTPAGAIVGVPMNILQSIFGIIIFFILAPVFLRILTILYPHNK